MPADFDVFFRAATGNTPYGYQRRLARAAAAELAGAASMEGPAPSGPFPCQSRLISIPTGLGKTASVILAWLWNRLGAPLQILVLPSPIASAAADLRIAGQRVLPSAPKPTTRNNERHHPV